VIWGSTYLAMRIAVDGIPPLVMASSRFVLSGVVLLTFLRLRGAPWPTLKEWAYALPVGTLMFSLGNATVAVAEQHLSSGVAAVVCGTMPLCTAALSGFFGEKPTRREWVGLVMGFAGVVVLASGGELAAEPKSAAILCVAPVAWSLASLLARKLPLAKGLMSAATQMVLGGVMMALFAVLAGEQVPTAPPLNSVLAWAYLAVFGSLVGYSAYTYLLRNARPAVATSYSYVNPAIAVAIGAAAGGETIGGRTIVAVLLIVAATVVVVRK
jgi:drug/metabolite transporter (DMT)-like permease